MRPPKILIIDDEPSLLQSLNTVLSSQYETILASSGEEGIALVRERAPDLVLLDIALPGMNGLETLRQIKRHDPDIVVLMITAHEKVRHVVEAMKDGAFDYLVKPLDLDELELTIERGLQTVRLTRQVKQLQSERIEQYHELRIIGESPPIKRILELIGKIVKSENTTVLIEGESGTGKELVARAIHYQSPRASGPFITINCGAIAKDLLEVELFGYERGTFTGGLPKGKKGKFELADGGTLLLDEVAELPLPTQVTLLRVIEERALYQVGGTTKRTIDVRIVATTNRNLQRAVESRQFREDLYYRLNVARIVMPPLRERGEDVLLLSRAFLAQFGERFNKTFTGFTSEAERLLLSHPWRGNVRELKNAIERVALVEDSLVVHTEHLSFIQSQPRPSISSSDDLLTLNMPAGGNVLEHLNRRLIEHALDLHHGNRSQAARFLGIPRQNLLYRLKKYGIKPGE
ncbi:MAG: sigma-54-dependent Fis family transcriptional regulator [Candidatus Latescibacteria bacterium]|nr:sigma-54-dependent Fis family transcriptional regulator [Candidatus Latescibacterota bacterium]